MFTLLPKLGDEIFTNLTPVDPTMTSSLWNFAGGRFEPWRTKKMTKLQKCLAMGAPLSADGLISTIFSIRGILDTMKLWARRFVTGMTVLQNSQQKICTDLTPLAISFASRPRTTRRSSLATCGAQTITTDSMILPVSSNEYFFNFQPKTLFDFQQKNFFPTNNLP